MGVGADDKARSFLALARSLLGQLRDVDSDPPASVGLSHFCNVLMVVLYSVKMPTSGDMLCDLESVEPVSTPVDELLRSRGGQNYRAPDRALAIFVAELFAILHPAILPMLERMFEDVKQDAENDGELELKRRAEVGIAAARIAAREQEAIET